MLMTNATPNPCTRASFIRLGPDDLVIPTASIELIVEITEVRLTAAFLIPWLSAFADQINPFVTLFSGEGTGYSGCLCPCKIIPPGRNGINLTDGAEIIYVRTLITRDTAGYGGNPFRI